MSDWTLFLTATGLALASAIAAIAAVVMAFRWRKAASGDGAPVRNGNGNHKHRPWFRFWLTVIGLVGLLVVLETILAGRIELTLTTSGFVGATLNGLITLLILSFKWWFESTDETPDTTETQNGAAQPDKAPEPTPTPLQQKARPDDY